MKKVCGRKSWTILKACYKINIDEVQWRCEPSAEIKRMNEMENEIRLQKMLAECGVASRRKAEELITEGAVSVNGHPAELGQKVNPKKDRVTVRGELIKYETEHVYLMLHKPRGIVTTMSDEMNRRCVAELVQDVPERVYPVGRLDRDSEGLLLMTNDGSFANALMHPAHHVPKVYRVTVRPGITEDQLTQMTVGVPLDGRMTAPAKVRVLSQEQGRAVLEYTLYEGRNREIRRVCELVGLEVARLKRTAVGCVRLGMLQPGQWRNLTAEEVRALKAEAQKDKRPMKTTKKEDGRHDYNTAAQRGRKSSFSKKISADRRRG